MLKDWENELNLKRDSEHWLGWAELIWARVQIDRDYQPPPLDEGTKNAIQKYIQECRESKWWNKWRLALSAVARLYELGLDPGISFTPEDWAEMLEELHWHKNYATTTDDFIERAVAMNIVANKLGSETP